MILKSAHALFLQKGYHATSMRQIAAQSNLTVGSLYNHFNNKEQIYLAVLKRYHPLREILPTLTEIYPATIQEFIRQAANLLIEHLRQDEDFLNLMFIEFVEFRAMHIPSLLDTLIPQINQLSKHISSYQSQLREIPINIVIRTFFGMFFAYSITEMIFGTRLNKYPSEQSLDYYLDIFLHGILLNEESNL
ncbi:MAG: TetR/AcrR family transcriptional regulator [Anaerolineales bacterium]